MQRRDAITALLEQVPSRSSESLSSSISSNGTATEPGDVPSLSEQAEPNWLQEAGRRVVEWEPWGRQAPDGVRGVELRIVEPIVAPPAGLEQVKSLLPELSRIFRVLDPLRDEIMIEGLTPPKIVVMGNQSSGKSTLLESLIKMPVFPRRSKFCTRMAIHVHLRRPVSDHEPPSVKMSVRTGRQEETAERVADAENSDETVIPIASGYRFVQDKMDQLMNESTASSRSGIVTDKYLLLEVINPEVPVLDLVDLPGMVHAEEEKTFPGKKEAIERIYDEQVKMDQSEGGSSCIYLVVHPSPSDTHSPVLNPAIQYVKNNGLLDRTIGVFTKADDSPADQLRAFVTGERLEVLDDDGSICEAADIGAVPLTHGWITTMLKGPRTNEDINYYSLHSLERLKKMEYASASARTSLAPLPSMLAIANM